MNNTVCIVTVPYVTNEKHLDYCAETYKSLISKENQISHCVVINHINSRFWPVFMDNYVPKQNTVIIENSENCLAKAWNIGIREVIKEADYVLVPNLDVILHPDCIDNLVKFAEKHPEAFVWTAAEWPEKETITEAIIEDTFHEHPNFSCFMVSKDLFEKLGAFEKKSSEPYPGQFDENYKPAYCEDVDMHQRIKRAGYHAYATNTARFFHYGSQTIKNDSKLHKEIDVAHMKNREYYASKFGGWPGEEGKLLEIE